MPTLVVYTSSPQDQALATLRYRAPAEALNWQIILGKTGTNTVHPERVHQADVVLIQRDFPRFFPAYLQVLAEARQAQKPLLYDLDDLLIALPADHPNTRDYEDGLGGILHTILAADRVIVSTPLLQEVLAPIQPNTVVWPTVLPDDLWTIKPPQPAQPESPIKIGYMGGTSHLPDTAVLIPPLHQIVKDVQQPIELHFWGCPPPDELAAYNPIYHPGITQYAAFAASFSTAAQVDIWLAPLQPTLFNRCKSAIKFWEYSAAGGAGVYSDIDPYQAIITHGENGFLAKTTEDWVTAVTQLITNPSLRQKIAQNAQTQLQTHGLLSTHLQSWQDIYTTTRSNPAAATANDPLFIQTMLRFSSQIQQRAEERHQEALNLYQQLYNIYESRWWRAWQRLKKIAGFDFSPVPHYRPFPTPDTDNEPS